MTRHEPSPPLTVALIAAAALAITGCVEHDYVRSYTYEYDGHNPLSGERRATQAMQDSCYASGYQYFRPEGPPQVERQAGAAGEVYKATQSFTCVGTVGGP
jgi:hypothetical protein